MPFTSMNLACPIKRESRDGDAFAAALAGDVPTSGAAAAPAAKS
jgi:hypothetical protein